MSEVMHAPVSSPPSLVAKLANKFGVEPNKMLSTLKATAFQTKGPEITNEQLMALLIVADQYGLNPWVKELYAFPDKNGGIIPIVSVDGYLRILNDQKEFNGLHCQDGPINKNGLPDWIECTIHRRDREHPTVIREYMAECKRATPAWDSHPRRMLRHRAIMQCARVAFAFTGIYDEDEGARIIEGTASVNQPAAIEDLNAQLRAIAPEATDESIAAVAKHIADAGKPPLDLTGDPSISDVLSMLQKAKTPDAIAAAEDLSRSLKLTEQQTAEVDVEIRAAMARVKK